VAYQDKSITCSDCSTTFTFTVAEQEDFASKGYTNEPKRCPACRQARKDRPVGNGGNSFGTYNSGPRPARQMFPVKCSECGKDTTVPFQPRSGKPVYCSDCYRKVKPSY
jgi:CxxC-x17-CxxC domain-containing protein